MVKVQEDITGWIMNERGIPDSRLTVIKQVEDYISPSGERKAQWLCECSCDEHNTIIAIGAAIKRGRIKSCGCLHKEQAVINGKQACKNNEYELFDSYVKLKFTNVDDYFYVSSSDFDTISQYAWHRARIKNYYYVATNQLLTENGTTKYKALRLTALIGCKHYDHIDGDPRNCRRENLRPATAQQNAQNRGLRSDNTSGTTGVYWNQKIHKWCASICVDGKIMHLGVFIDKADAIKARLRAEEKYFGEFSRNTNSHKEE